MARIKVFNILQLLLGDLQINMSKRWCMYYVLTSMLSRWHACAVCVCVCVEVFRALRVSLTCNDLCDILSRLVETVAEQGEDMQVSLDSPV